MVRWKCFEEVHPDRGWVCYRRTAIDNSSLLSCCPSGGHCEEGCQWTREVSQQQQYAIIWSGEASVLWSKKWQKCLKARIATYYHLKQNSPVKIPYFYNEKNEYLPIITKELNVPLIVIGNQPDGTFVHVKIYANSQSCHNIWHKTIICDIYDRKEQVWENYWCHKWTV